MPQKNKIALLYPILLFISILLDYKIKISILTLTPNRLIVVVFFVLALFANRPVKIRQIWHQWNRLAKFIAFMLVFWLLYGTVALLWTTNVRDGGRELLNLAFNILIVFTCMLLYHEQETQKTFLKVMKGILAGMILLMGFEMFTGYHLPLSRYSDVNILLTNVLVSYIPTGISFNQNDQAFLMLLFMTIPLAELFLLIRNRKSLSARQYNQFIIPILLILFTLLMLASADSFIIFSSLLITVIAASLLVLPVAGLGFSGSVFVLWKFGFVHFFQSIERVRPNFQPFFDKLAKLARSIPLINPANAVTNVVVDPSIIGEVGTANDLSIYEVMAANSSSLAIRSGLILEGIRQFLCSFGRGVGPNGYKDHIVDLKLTMGKINPHCWFIEILSQYGIMVFLAYVASLLFMLISLLKTKMYKNSPIILTAILILIAFVPGSFVPSQLLQYWPQWLFFGFVAAVCGGKLPAVQKSAS